MNGLNPWATIHGKFILMQRSSVIQVGEGNTVEVLTVKDIRID
jgi:hypothetical protein